MNRLKKNLRLRLELAWGRENYLLLTLPTTDCQRVRASPIGIEFDRLGNEWMVDENGRPREAYVRVLERYVAALKVAAESQWRGVMVWLARSHPTAEEACKRLVRAGANPVWMMEDCLREKPHRSESAINEHPDRRQHVVRRMRTLSQQFKELANDYEISKRAAEDIGTYALRENTTILLRRESRSLARVAKAMTARGPSPLTRRILDLLEHVKLTTGGFQDHEVCRLLDALAPRGHEKHWTPGMLEQQRLRQRRQRKGLQMSTAITDMLDEQITQRRAAARM